MPSQAEKARLEILDAFRRAKEANPKLTQGEFMLRGAPGASIEGAKTGRFKDEKSASSYFSKLVRGTRSGSNMIEESHTLTRSSLFQARIKLRDKVYNEKTGVWEEKWVAQNIVVAGGRGTFDIPAAEDKLRKPENMKKFQDQLAKFKSKYALPEMTFDDQSIQVKAIHHQRKPVTLRLRIP